MAPIKIPVISYGSIEQTIGPTIRCLLNKAGFQNGSYETQDFVAKLNSIPLYKIKTKENKKAVKATIECMRSYAELGDIVNIRDFYPAQQGHETSIDTAFSFIPGRFHSAH